MEAVDCFNTNNPTFGTRIVVEQQNGGKFFVSSIHQVGLRQAPGVLELTAVKSSSPRHEAFKDGEKDKIVAFIARLDSESTNSKKNRAKDKKRK